MKFEITRLDFDWSDLRSTPPCEGAYISSEKVNFMGDTETDWAIDCDTMADLMGIIDNVKQIGEYRNPPYDVIVGRSDKKGFDGIITIYDAYNE